MLFAAMCLYRAMFVFLLRIALVDVHRGNGPLFPCALAGSYCLLVLLMFVPMSLASQLNRM